MIIVGPTLKSGIGQHAYKYTNLFPGSKYLQLTDPIPKNVDMFVFALPVEPWVQKLREWKTYAKSIICMTVCETETVHEDYGKLFNLFDKIAVPSQFCKNIFSRQFPETQFHVINAHIPVPYTFYHIGNILDPRKNFNKIIEAFFRLNKPDCKLVIKATCLRDFQINLPNVEVIKDMLSDEEMNALHDRCDCYVSFSHSEGVGMGAVEAAMKNKPVILAKYGGATEYIKTPYAIDCKLTTIEKDDFMFKKGMEWGDPDFDQLLEFMNDAYTKRLKYMDHSFTRIVTSSENVLRQFQNYFISDQNYQSSK